MEMKTAMLFVHFSAAMQRTECERCGWDKHLRRQRFPYSHTFINDLKPQKLLMDVLLCYLILLEKEWKESKDFKYMSNRFKDCPEFYNSSSVLMYY